MTEEEKWEARFNVERTKRIRLEKLIENLRWQINILESKSGDWKNILTVDDAKVKETS